MTSQEIVYTLQNVAIDVDIKAREASNKELKELYQNDLEGLKLAIKLIGSLNETNN